MIHDDDIEPGTRCLWFEPRTNGQTVVSTVTEVHREEDGHVRGVVARSETGDFGRTFSRYRGEEYFCCGRFLLYVGSWEPEQSELDRLANAYRKTFMETITLHKPDDAP